MAGYIGSKASVVSSGAERKKTFAISTTTTSLTGLSYTPTYVHVFHNGVRLVDGSDFTATNGTSITLSNSAVSGDEVVVISYSSFQVADHYNKTESDTRFINTAGDTLTGTLGGTAVNLSGDLAAVNTTLTGYLRGPASFTIDPATHADDTGLVIIAGNLQVDGSTTTINSTTLTVDDLNLTLASGAADSAAANGAGITIDGASASLLYSHSGTKFVLNKPLDVTGNIAVTGTVDGVDIQTLNTTAGAALPKAGGTMTGIIQLNNAVELRTKDTGGNARTIVRANSSNELEFGWSANAPVKFMGGGSYTERMRIHTNSNIGINDIAPFGTLTVTGPRILVQRTNDDSSIVFANNATGTPASHTWAAGLNYSNSNAFTIAYNASQLPSLEEHKMVIDTSGNVGIGTDSPTSKLEVIVTQSDTMTDDTAAFAIKGNGGDGILMGQRATTPYAAWIAAGYLPNIGTSHNYPLTLQPHGGNVGIGTTAPASPLHVKKTGSTSAVQEFLRLENHALGGAGAGSSINFHHYHAGGGPAGGAKAASINAQNMASWPAGTPSSYSTGLTFSTLHENTFAERMRIGSNGNLELAYAGAARQQADNQAFSIITPANGGGQGIAFKRLDTNNDQGLGEISWSNNSQDGQANIRVKTAGAVNSTDMHFDVNNAGTLVTAISIDGSANGNVGIGETNPSHRLHINGGSNDEARVRVSNTAGGQASLDLNNSEGYFRTYTDAGEYRIYDQTDSVHRLIIDTSGNVGIGTDTPEAPLDITPNGSTKKTIRVDNASQRGYQEYVISGTIGANAVTITMQCPSYFQSEVVATFQQSNGGADNNVYFNGIWSNNHTTHLFKNKTDGGTVPRIGSLGSATPAFTVGVGDAASNTGKLTFTKAAAGGTSGTFCVHVRAYGYNNQGMTYVVS